jgi:hypothetical protein
LRHCAPEPLLEPLRAFHGVCCLGGPAGGVPLAAHPCVLCTCMHVACAPRHCLFPELACTGICVCVEEALAQGWQHEPAFQDPSLALPACCGGTVGVPALQHCSAQRVGHVGCCQALPLRQQLHLEHGCAVTCQCKLPATGCVSCVGCAGAQLQCQPKCWLSACDSRCCAASLLRALYPVGVLTESVCTWPLAARSCHLCAQSPTFQCWSVRISGEGLPLVFVQAWSA